MRLPRPTFLLGLLTLLVVSVPPGCNTKAVGIDECRDIESARCEAGVYCKTAFAIDDISECKRYYRDQCLHGLDVSKAPGKPEVSQCVATLKQLGSCAKKHGEDSLVTDCADATSTNTKVATVCQLLKTPEAAPECAFLDENVSKGTGGSGGESGSGGAAGHAGTSGEAGISGSSNGGSGGKDSST